MVNTFLTATDARNKARNDLLVFNEIRDIEYQILLAVNAGQLVANVNNTVMTTNTSYYNVWMKTVINPSLNDQMTQVMSYFQSLGYSIVQLESTTTAGVFYWSIAW